jgi:hypothetical protein
MAICLGVISHLVESILGGFRAALRSERLPPPPTVPAPRRAPGVLGLIFQQDSLPSDPVPPARPPRRIFALLFGIEKLEEAPPAPPRRRSHWLTWLFGPERLDD